MYKLQLIAPMTSEASLRAALRSVPGSKVRQEGNDTRMSVLTISFSDLDALDALYGWWQTQDDKDVTMITDRGRWRVLLKRHSADDLKTIVEEDRHLISSKLPHLGEG